MPDDPAAPALWRRGDRYAYLHGVERTMFAWEWLRRTDEYRRAWQEAENGALSTRCRIARGFGLIELMAPTLDSSTARPMWRAGFDPRVLPATTIPGEFPRADRLDIRRLADWAWVAIDDDDVEHWRIGTAARSLRLDVSAGTLLGGPTPLRFELVGLDRIRHQIKPLDELIALSSGSPVTPPGAGDPRAERWILELRTADALAEEVGQRDIARSLLGHKIANASWRSECDSIRSRTRRLIRSARARLADPLAALWFK